MDDNVLQKLQNIAVDNTPDTDNEVVSDRPIVEIVFPRIFFHLFLFCAILLLSIWCVPKRMQFSKQKMFIDPKSTFDSKSVIAHLTSTAQELEFYCIFYGAASNFTFDVTIQTVHDQSPPETISLHSVSTLITDNSQNETLPVLFYIDRDVHYNQLETSLNFELNNTTVNGYAYQWVIHSPIFEMFDTALRIGYLICLLSNIQSYMRVPSSYIQKRTVMLHFALIAYCDPLFFLKFVIPYYIDSFRLAFQRSVFFSYAMFYMLSVFTAFGTAGIEISSGDNLMTYLFGILSLFVLIFIDASQFEMQSILWTPSTVPSHDIEIGHAFVFGVFFILLAYRIIVSVYTMRLQQTTRFYYSLFSCLVYLLVSGVLLVLGNGRAVSTIGFLAASYFFLDLMEYGSVPYALTAPETMYSKPDDAEVDDFGVDMSD